MQITVIEDRDRPAASRRIGFGSSGFVTDGFCEEARTTLPPPISTQVIRRWQDGCSPILEPEAIREANSGPGLNLLILHIGWSSQLTLEEIRHVKGKLLEALLFFHSGYQLKEVMQEIYSDDERQRAQAAGALVQNDYSAYYFAHPEALPPLPRRPYLMGGRRDEVQDGSYLSPLFFYSPPRFFFKPGEQDLLWLALMDKSDEEITRLLHLSPSAVQKRWRASYERVAAVMPDLLPWSDLSGAEAQTRGTEKRRHLLRYLRSHPEELRPICKPK